MAYEPEFGEWVREHFGALGPLEIKRMFGAAGVYSNGLIFAILGDGEVWLKADDQTIPALAAAGSRAFAVTGKDGEMTTSYWSLPASATDDPEEAVEWARGAIDAAMRKQAAKRVRRR